MRRGLWVVLAVWVAAMPARALPFEPGEHVTMAISFMRMGIGDVDVDVSQDIQSGVRVWPLTMHAQTNRFFNHVHAVNDSFVASFDPLTLRSLGSVFDQHESNQEATESTRIDGASAFVHRVTKKGTSDRVATVPPGSLDILSAIFYLRSQPIEAAPELRIPIFTGNKSWELVARVVGRETIRTDAGQFNTIVLRCRTFFNGQFSSKKELSVWLTDDDRRIPVKVEADFLMGTMRAELKSYHQGPLAQR